MQNKLQSFFEELRGFPDYDEMKEIGVNSKGNGSYPLHYAIVQNRYDVVSLLLENDADPNLKETNGNTSLDEAIMFERKEMVELILDYGGKLYMFDQKDLEKLKKA